MYKYETHCHTSPVSQCGKASVEDCNAAKSVSFMPQISGELK